MDSGLNVRRIRKITVGGEALLMMLTEGSKFTVIKGVPDGAKFLGVEAAPLTSEDATLYFSHESFPPVLQGDRVPEIETNFLSEES